MHIHGNQLDVNLQVQALAAAAKADEKEAERTREKLRKAAAALAGESDSDSDDADCVVRLSGDDPGQEQAGQQGRGEQKPDKEAAAEDDGEVFSDWA